MFRCHDPLFSGQSALPSLPIYAPLTCRRFQLLEKKCIFSLVLGQNLSSQDAKFLNFRTQDPLFFKENPLPRPQFWKPARHIPTKKKVSAPPGTYSLPLPMLLQFGASNRCEYEVVQHMGNMNLFAGVYPGTRITRFCDSNTIRLSKDRWFRTPNMQ